MSDSERISEQVAPTPTGYTRGPDGSGALANHPMRSKAVEAILEGKSLRSILKWMTPPVSLETVGRLRRQVIKELDAARVLHKAKELQAIASNAPVPEDDTGRMTKLAVAGSEHVARIERLLSPLERQVHMADAENDRQGLGTLAKAALSAIRTQAELDGSLAQAGPQQTTNNQFNIIVLPNEDEASHEVIDVLPDTA